MADPTDYLDRLEEVYNATTHGTWARHDFGYPGQDEPSSIVVYTGEFDWQAIRDGEEGNAVAWMPGWDLQEDNNARFIVQAHAAVPGLLGALNAVLDLHRPSERDYGRGVIDICEECSGDQDAYWPCITWTAVATELEEM